MKKGSKIWVKGSEGIPAQGGTFLGKKVVSGEMGYRIKLNDGRTDLVHPSLIVSRKPNPPLQHDGMQFYTVDPKFLQDVTGTKGSPSKKNLNKSNIMAEMLGMKVEYNRKKGTDRKPHGYVIQRSTDDGRSDPWEFLGNNARDAADNFNLAIKAAGIGTVKPTTKPIASSPIPLMIEDEPTAPKGKRGRKKYTLTEEDEDMANSLALMALDQGMSKKESIDYVNNKLALPRKITAKEFNDITDNSEYQEYQVSVKARAKTYKEEKTATKTKFSEQDQDAIIGAAYMEAGRGKTNKEIADYVNKMIDLPKKITVANLLEIAGDEIEEERAASKARRKSHKEKQASEAKADQAEIARLNRIKKAEEADAMAARAEEARKEKVAEQARIDAAKKEVEAKIAKEKAAKAEAEAQVARDKAAKEQREADEAAKAKRKAEIEAKVATSAQEVVRESFATQEVSTSSEDKAKAIAGFGDILTGLLKNLE